MVSWVVLARLSEREAIIMQMQQVHYFLALCEELNFTRAARRCGVSQPTLTTAISALDEIARNADHARKVARTLTARPGADRSARQTVDSSEHPSN